MKPVQQLPENITAKPIFITELTQKIGNNPNLISQVDVQRYVGAIHSDSLVDVYFTVAGERRVLQRQKLVEFITAHRTNCIDGNSPQSCRRWGMESLYANDSLKILLNTYGKTPTERFRQMAIENPEAVFYVGDDAVPLLHGALGYTQAVETSQFNLMVAESIRAYLKTPSKYKVFNTDVFGPQKSHCVNWLMGVLYPREQHVLPTNKKLTRKERNKINQEMADQILIRRNEVIAILDEFQRVAHNNNWIDSRYQVALPAQNQEGINLLVSLGLIKQK